MPHDLRPLDPRSARFARHLPRPKTRTRTSFTLNGLPTPDIVVSPVFGLVTSESGSSVEFSVRLTTAPTADVIVPLSVSDATEFRVPVAALTFTPANWQLTRQGAVVGVDDALVNGDIAGSVILVRWQYQHLHLAHRQVAQADAHM